MPDNRTNRSAPGSLADNLDAPCACRPGTPPGPALNITINGNSVFPFTPPECGNIYGELDRVSALHREDVERLDAELARLGGILKGCMKRTGPQELGAGFALVPSEGKSITFPDRTGTVALLDDLPVVPDPPDLAPYMKLAGEQAVRGGWKLSGTSGSAPAPVVTAELDTAGRLLFRQVIGPQAESSLLDPWGLTLSTGPSDGSGVFRTVYGIDGIGHHGDTFLFPGGGGTLARTSDLPDLAPYMKLAGEQAVDGTFAFRSGDTKLSLPAGGGTLARTSDLPDLAAYLKSDGRNEVGAGWRVVRTGQFELRTESLSFHSYRNESTNLFAGGLDLESPNMNDPSLPHKVSFLAEGMVVDDIRVLIRYPRPSPDLYDTALALVSDAKYSFVPVYGEGSVLLDGAVNRLETAHRVVLPSSRGFARDFLLYIPSFSAPLAIDHAPGEDHTVLYGEPGVLDMAEGEAYILSFTEFFSDSYLGETRFLVARKDLSKMEVVG